MIPVFITEHQPRPVQGYQAEKILDRFISLSDELDTKLEKIGDMARVVKLESN